MATVTASYIFTGVNDWLTFAKLNLLGQPSVALAAGEIVTSNLGTNLALSGLSLNANTPFIGSMSTDTFAASISITIDTTKGNTHFITCTNAFAAVTLTPSGAGVAGQNLWIVFFADNTVISDVVTFASPFKSLGTFTLNSSGRKYTIEFVSDGTNWCEVNRVGPMN